MPTLIVETGSANSAANSYISLEAANAYHDARLHTEDWTAADDATRTRALITATQVIDAEFDWSGSRVSVGQALDWPRYDVPRRDMNGSAVLALMRQVNGEDYWPSDRIPDRLQQATAELARLLLAEDRTADNPAKGIKKLGLGSGALEIEFDPGDRLEPLPPYVQNLLEPFGKDRSNGGAVRVKRA